MFFFKTVFHDAFLSGLLEVSSTQKWRCGQERGRYRIQEMEDPPTGEAKEISKIMVKTNTRETLKSIPIEQLTSLRQMIKRLKRWNWDFIVTIYVWVYQEEINSSGRIWRRLANNYTQKLNKQQKRQLLK